MSTLVESMTIRTDSQRAWKVAGDFTNTAYLVGTLASGDYDGEFQFSLSEGGAQVVERVLRYDHQDLTFTYEFVSDDMLLEQYVSALPCEENSAVVWSLEAGREHTQRRSLHYSTSVVRQLLRAVMVPSISRNHNDEKREMS